MLYTFIRYEENIIFNIYDESTMERRGERKNTLMIFPILMSSIYSPRDRYGVIK
jgi:hypothetical protein